mgnify:CR=1 FL=1
MPHSSRPISTTLLFLIFFGYTTAVALLFQKLLLPISSQSSHGLITGDAVYFNKVAMELAERIRTNGWSEWRLSPAWGADGNVAILAALYAMFKPDISLILPLNAACHALGGVLLVNLAQLTWSGRAARVAGLLAGTLFVLQPSALNWYAQAHKDGLSILGSLLILTAWMRANGHALTVRQGAGVLLTAALGCLALFVVRPYLLQIVLIALLLTAAVPAALASFRSTNAPFLRRTVFHVLILAILAVATWTAPRTRSIDIEDYQWAPTKESTALPGTLVPGARPRTLPAELKEWKWQPSAWLPKAADRRFQVLAQTRASFAESGIRQGASSMIDEARMPQSAASLLLYAPRALQIAVLAPFPNRWLDKITSTRLVAIVETTLWYLIAPGIGLTIYYGRLRNCYPILIFALFSLVIFGLTISNIGSLYRVRYVYMSCLSLVGLAGWMEFMSRRSWLRRRIAERFATVSLSEVASVGIDLSVQRRGIVKSGNVVGGLMAVAYTLLALRDVLMARIMGLGMELDAFALGTTIPMFLVAAVSSPLGTAIIPAFLTTRETSGPQETQQLLSRIITAYLAFAGLLTATLIVGMFWYVHNRFGGSSAMAHETGVILAWMTPVFVLSGLVILGNALLNALGNFTQPALLQMIAPVVAIAGLLLFRNTFGAAGIAVGMLLGQIANFVFVWRCLGRMDIRLSVVRMKDFQLPKQFLGQYAPVALAVTGANLALPVGMIIASSLPQGSLAALSLGSKVTILVTNLVGTVIAAIILPYLARISSRSGEKEASKELSLLAMIGTTMAVPVAIILFCGVEFAIGLLFRGGAFGTSDVSVVSRIAEFGIMQLPFFVANLLLFKFAIATHQAKRVAIVTLVASVANVALDFLLMPAMGASGIALAISLSVVLSAGLTLAWFWRLGFVNSLDAISISINWLLFLVAIVCLRANSYPGLVSAALAFLLLLAALGPGVSQRLRGIDRHAVKTEPGKVHVANILKRAIDIAVAAALLCIMAPVMLGTAVAVYRDLGRPMFLRQTRPGRHGRPFTVLKFRSMSMARDANGELLPDAARLSPFGHWLRSTSLDELPQLVNVLRGDMSLVGPRPLLMEYLPLYSPWHARRHEVRPGITGWAQVNGRNAVSWEHRLEFDVWYVDHQSLRLDLHILWLTLAKVLLRHGIGAAGEATMPRFTGSQRKERESGGKEPS